MEVSFYMYYPKLSTKFLTFSPIDELISGLQLLYSPDNWFEEVVNNTDEVGWMNYETCFQVLFVSPVNNLLHKMEE